MSDQPLDLQALRAQVRESLDAAHDRRRQTERALFAIRAELSILDRTLRSLGAEADRDERQAQEKAERGELVPMEGDPTLDDVRTGAVLLAKEPPQIETGKFGGGYSSLKHGWYTTTQMCELLGLPESSAKGGRLREVVRSHNAKLAREGILESAPFRTGQQYRYRGVVEDEASLPERQPPPEIEAIGARSETGMPVEGTGKRVFGADKDIDEMLHAAEDQGFLVEKSGSDHWRVKKPSGGKNSSVGVTASVTTPRGVRSAKTRLRKLGVQL
jgi:hypothetical protein